MLTVEEVSLWELAHRLAGEDPYCRYWFRAVPPGVKDWCRTLLDEILKQHLECSLITKQRAQTAQAPPEFYLHSHYGAIYACIGGRNFPKRFLKFVQIHKWDYEQWRSKTKGFELPELWTNLEFERPDEGSEHPNASEETAKAFAEWPETALIFLRQGVEEDDLHPKRKGRYEALIRAVELWMEDSDRPINQVCQQLWDEGHGQPWVRQSTMRGWIQPFASKNVQNKPGRPKKLPESEKKSEQDSTT